MVIQKITENHKTSDCPKSGRTTSDKCALCSGGHPANYKGCKVYAEIRIKSQEKLRRTEPETNKYPSSKEIHIISTENMINTQKINTYKVLKQQKCLAKSPHIETIVQLLTNQTQN